MAAPATSTALGAPALLLLLLAMPLPFCAATRVQVTFDYGWRFQLGDPAGVSPVPLTTAALDPTFVYNVSGMVCTNLA